MMCARKMARDVRAKNLQVLDHIMTQLVGLKMIQLFPRRQGVGIRPAGIEAAEMTQRIKPESARQVGTVEKTPNLFFENSDHPLLNI